MKKGFVVFSRLKVLRVEGFFLMVSLVVIPTKIAEQSRGGIS
jgi:hypothetical protein